MNRTLAILLLCFNISIFSNEKEAILEDFSSDNCSSFPNGTFSQKDLWKDCCIIHDISYWMGGTKEERKRADKELGQCVGSKGRKLLSIIMPIGVQIGGSPFFPTPWRWGYGWQNRKGYQELNEDEKEVVFESLLMSDFYDEVLLKEGAEKRGIEIP